MAASNGGAFFDHPDNGENGWPEMAIGLAFFVP
jgi:hypothetical protein